MWWLERAQPDVLLMQETKLADADAPASAFRDAGYELAHHGEGRWNGVAIASRCGIDGVVTNFGQPLRPAADQRRRRRRAARRSADDRGALRRRASGERVRAQRTRRSARRSTTPSSPGSIASPAGSPRRRIPPSRWCSAATSTSRPKTSTCGIRAPATAGPTCRRRSARPSPVFAAGGSSTPIACIIRSRGRYTWWDYRAGNFHKNFGMRIDHLLATPPARGAHGRWAEIDREARKGKPLPSDHAPLVIDIDQPGRPFDAGWTSAEGRIAARRAGAR